MFLPFGATEARHLEFDIFLKAIADFPELLRYPFELGDARAAHLRYICMSGQHHTRK